MRIYINVFIFHKLFLLVIHTHTHTHTHRYIIKDVRILMGCGVRE